MQIVSLREADELFLHRGVGPWEAEAFVQTRFAEHCLVLEELHSSTMEADNQNTTTAFCWVSIQGLKLQGCDTRTAFLQG